MCVVCVCGCVDVCDLCVCVCFSLIANIRKNDPLHLQCVIRKVLNNKESKTNRQLTT